MADLMTSCYTSHYPFAVASALYKGYTKERTITPEERRVLKLLICCRLLQTYILSAHSAAANPSNDYIQLERTESWQLCNMLWGITDKEFSNRVYKS